MDISTKLTKEDIEVLIDVYSKELYKAQEEQKELAKKERVLIERIKELKRLVEDSFGDTGLKTIEVFKDSIKSSIENIAFDINKRAFCLELLKQENRFLQTDDFLLALEKRYGIRITPELKTEVSNTLASLKFSKKVNNHEVIGKKDKLWGLPEWYFNNEPSPFY